jgi:endonuclease/exonuclease/phosphatase (EEP) superfamily protein YafD
MSHVPYLHTVYRVLEATPRLPRPPSPVATASCEELIGSGIVITTNRLLPYRFRAEGRAIIVVLVLTRASAVTVFLCSIAGFMGEVHQYLELSSHFKLQYLIVALACLLVFVALQAWRSALYACFTFFLNLAMVLPWYLPQSPANLKQAHYRVKLLFTNVQSANKNFSDFISFVIEEDPHVLIIQEATQPWIDRLKVLQERFPYEKTLPKPRGVGIALYSRMPVERFDIISLGSERVSALLARLNRGGRVLSVVTVHPRNPLRRGNFRQRNEQLWDTASIVQALPEPKILVGDLNASLWSPYYAHLIRQTGLNNAREGFGLLPTWPAFMSWPFLMIPIDHCLVSPDIDVLRMRTGRNIGSDHLPIIVDMTIPD